MQYGNMGYLIYFVICFVRHFCVYFFNINIIWDNAHQLLFIKPCLVLLRLATVLWSIFYLTIDMNVLPDAITNMRKPLSFNI